MNLPSRTALPLATLFAVSFALVGCGAADESETTTEELTEQPSTQTPPSKAAPAPHVEVGSSNDLSEDRADYPNDRPIEFLPV